MSARPIPPRAPPSLRLPWSARDPPDRSERTVQCLSDLTGTSQPAWEHHSSGSATSHKSCPPGPEADLKPAAARRVADSRTRVPAAEGACLFQKRLVRFPARSETATRLETSP